MKHIQNLLTKSYFINRFGQLSDSFLFYQLQDMAWEHADLLGYGYNQLKEDQRFWVLSRLLVKIDRRPVWGEKFSVETWSRGTDGFFGFRDYNFRDETGNKIIRATSSWLVLDLKSRRIVRISDLDNFPTLKESALDETAGKVRSPKSEQKLSFTPALFNEIDINQHFNSGRFIERITDSYDCSFHEKNELAEFEINFLKEGMPDDNLAVKKQLLDDKNHLCSVVRELDERELVRARLVWKER